MGAQVFDKRASRQQGYGEIEGRNNEKKRN
jgi:hypothetical protein